MPDGHLEKGEAMNTETTQVVVSRRKFSGKQVILVVGLAMLVMALGVVLWINQYVNAAMFPPTRLGESEQQVLNVKMAHLLHTADSLLHLCPNLLPPR